MALVYSPMQIWPRKWLSLYREVLSKDGLHYTLKVGRKWASQNIYKSPSGNKKNALVTPIYKGYTLRCFLFADQKEGESYLGVYWSDSVTVWKCRVRVNNGDVRTYDEYDKSKYIGDVYAGDIYTAALRTDDQVYFQMSFNGKDPNKAYLKTILTKDKYDLWGATGNHTLVSLHFYNESSFPTPHLGDNLYLDYFILPFGTYGLYVVVYTGNVEPVEVHVQQFPEKPKLDFTFENNGRLKKHETFYSIVRTTTHGYSVSMSFDPKPQFKPAGTAIDQMQCHFSYGSIKNAHITSFK